MNQVIYADLEAFLKPYHTCDNEYNITKEINKHEACGYFINVVNNQYNVVNVVQKKINKPIIQVKMHLLNFAKSFVKQEEHYLILK